MMTIMTNYIGIATYSIACYKSAHRKIFRQLTMNMLSKLSS